MLPLTELSDPQVLSRFRETGDPADFAELVRRHEALIRRLCYGMLRDPDLAEDVAQDTFLRAFRSAGTVKQVEAVRSWLVSIACNRARDELRRKSRRRENSDGVESAFEATVPNGPLSPLAVLEKKERRDEISAALAELPEKHRVPLVLKEVLGYTYEEIGRILAIPRGTAQVRIHRGRVQMRARLKPAADSKEGVA